MFILSTKSRKVVTWYSTEGLVSPLNLGKCFRYPSEKFSNIWGRTKVAYISCTMSWKAIVEGGVWGDWLDDEEEEEDDEYEGDEEESVGVLVCGGEKYGGYLLEYFKGALITNLWTPEGNSSLFSSKGFEYT